MANLLDREVTWSTNPDNCGIQPDWKIQTLVGGTEHATYNVHKAILGSEPNCSKYFLDLFTGGREYTESETNTSTIDLKNDAAADAFQILLDIFYWKTVSVDDLSPENSVALYHLLDYFQVNSEFTGSIEHFWKESVKGDDCGEWYVCAEQFGNDKLMEIVLQKCAEKIEDVKLDSLIIQVSNAKFWIDVSASTLDVSASTHHSGVARLVAEFCILHKDQDQLDADMLYKLMGGNFSWASHELSESCLKLMQAEKAVGSHGGESNLTKIQEHCAFCLKFGDWQRVLEDNSIQDSLQELGSHVYKVVMNACHKRNSCEHSAKDDALNSSDPGSLPMSITIAAAGIPEANGVYVRASDTDFDQYIFNQVNPMYFKDEIVIYGKQFFSSEKFVWYIKDTDENVTLSWVPGYSSSTISKFPPKTGWYSPGEFGNPTLSYNW